MQNTYPATSFTTKAVSFFVVSLFSLSDSSLKQCHSFLEQKPRKNTESLIVRGQPCSSCHRKCFSQPMSFGLDLSSSCGCR